MIKVKKSTGDAMRFLMFISNMLIPLIIFYILGFGVLMKRNIYEDFVEGATDGFKTVVKIMPTLVGLLVAVGILRASGFLDVISQGLGKVTEGSGLPSSVVPVVIVRLFSASAANGLVLDIFKEFGVDSYAGRVAAIIMSCTETVFYTMSLYCTAAKVTKTRYTLPGVIAATAAGVIASLVVAGHM